MPDAGVRFAGSARAAVRAGSAESGARHSIPPAAIPPAAADAGGNRYHPAIDAPGRPVPRRAPPAGAKAPMIHRDDHDGIAVLRIEHGKANTLDTELCDAIVEAFEDASAARAVVLTGTGRIFSAGVDLFRVVEGGRSYIDAFVPAMCRAFERIFFHPAPVVTAANGHAIAGGCLLVAAADQRLMADGDGRIGIPELRLGVPFPPIALEIMRFATPPQHFQSIVYHAETHPPSAALALGLLDEVAEPGALLDRALAVAERLASVRGETFAITKREIRRPAMVRVRSLEQTVAREVHARWLEPRTLDGIRDYLARTLPKNR